MEKEYTYGVARIRALESSLFSNEIIQELLQCRDYNEAMNFLRDRGWGNGDLNQDITDMLNDEKEKSVKILEELIEDKDAMDILTIKDRFHNLKAAIKQVCTEDETKNIFYDIKDFDADFIKEAIKNGEYYKLPDNMAGVAKEATDTLLKTGNGQLCDVIVDKATLYAIKEAGEKAKNELIKKYANLQLLIANLKMAVRCAKTQKDIQFIEHCLVPCSDISVTDLKNACAEGIDSLLDYLKNTGFGDAANAYEKSISVFECWCDNKIIEEIKSEKYKSFSLGPIVAYYIARENEIKTVKIILSGKQNGFDNEFIGERIRVMYA